MLTGITSDANNYIHFTYNADGLRLQKTVCESGTERETHYIWNEGRLIAEYDDTQAITVLYDSENSPVGFTVETGEAPNQSIATYIYLKNLQGDITHILDEDGETVVSYTYDPWGNPTVQGNTIIAAANPCSYRGYYYDQETGWYHLQSRYYDPEIGRFPNADEASLASVCGNLYFYGNNNPTNYSDSKGCFGTPIQWACAVIGGLVGWIFLFSKIQQLITYASNGSNEIRTYLWGRQVTIRFYFKDGIINSVDAFIGWSSRIIGKYIKGY